MWERVTPFEDVLFDIVECRADDSAELRILWDEKVDAKGLGVCFKNLANGSNGGKIADEHNALKPVAARRKDGIYARSGA